jgi:hypothetical protein
MMLVLFCEFSDLLNESHVFLYFYNKLLIWCWLYVYVNLVTMNV